MGKSISVNTASIEIPAPSQSETRFRFLKPREHYKDKDVKGDPLPVLFCISSASVFYDKAYFLKTENNLPRLIFSSFEIACSSPESNHMPSH